MKELRLLRLLLLQITGVKEPGFDAFICSWRAKVEEAWRPYKRRLCIGRIADESFGPHRLRAAICSAVHNNTAIALA